MIKKIFSFLIFSLLTISICFAESYKINSVTYYSSGITKSLALQRNIYVDEKKILNSEEELQNTIKDITQQLENLRLLEDVSSTYTLLPQNEDGVFPVDLTFTVSDSKHFLLLPKPSFDSNSGFELKLKMKDSNFFGLLNTFNFDFNGQIENNIETNGETLYKFGINFDYDYPFKTGPLLNTWSNDFEFSWTVGDSSPEFNYETGLSFSLPLGRHFLTLSLSQSIIRDEDYKVFNDSLYAVEKTNLSMPITIGMIGRSTKVIYTPSINYTYNWDFDSINIDNEDLASPYINISQTISTSHINWIGNFRNGFSLSAVQSFGWNFQTEQFVPSVSCDVSCFKNFKYLGLCFDSYVVAALHSNTNIGSRLRGIIDKQYFADGSYYALKVPSAIVFNFDMPIHIVTTDWLGWCKNIFGPYDELSTGMKKFCYIPHKLFSVLNFELQASPFIDVALTRNKNIDSSFKIKDGFYSGGLELLIYPSKWKSYVIRTSVGFDLGRLFLDNYLNMDWRDTSVSPYEIYFGLGLNY